MSQMESEKERKIHTRNINITTFESGNEYFVVEGILKEDRKIPLYSESGEKKLPYTIHHLIIRLRINVSTLIIEDVEVEMLKVPHEDCPETLQSLLKLKGLKIAPGFAYGVKSRLGGVKGCSHLASLIFSMAPAIVQGFWVHRTRSLGDHTPSAELLDQYLVDSCWVWRKGGNLAKQYENPGQPN